MSESKDLVAIEEDLARQAAAISSRVQAPSGNRIRITQDKKFTMPDGTENPGPVELVIVDFAAGNFLYTTPYVEGQVSPPDCFALGLEANTLVPSDNSPNKRAASCGVCPNNQYKSAANGKGKLCRNTRILAVLPADATDETPLHLLTLSPTACGPFDEYALKVSRAFKGPPIKVISTIGFDPTAKYPTLRFGPPRPNPRLVEMFGRQEEARTMLLVEPDIAAMEAQVAPQQAQPNVVRGGVRRPAR